MKILLATTNLAKVERYRKLLKLADADTEVVTLDELEIFADAVEETGATLEENALLKAKALQGKTNLAIFANDAGFYVEGEGFVVAPKRVALEGGKERNLRPEEITQKILDCWKGIARRHGGKINAAWVDAFIVLYPNGEIAKAEARREVILTDTEMGTPHAGMPIRALYYSKATGKPALEQSAEDELVEMRPVVEALKKVLKS